MSTAIETDRALGADFVEHHVDVDGFRIRYFEAGSGEPLVALHGASGPAFTVALDLLARRFRVLLFELPGWGEQPNDTSQTVAELGETIATAIAAIGIESYHLVGSSFGGWTALRIALSHPDRVRRLVLEAPSAFRVGAPDLFGRPVEAMRAALRHHPDRSPVWAPLSPDKAKQVGPLLAKLRNGPPPYDEALAEALRGFDIPTLVLFGTEDGVIPPDNGRIYRRLMPNCAYVLVHDAAHEIQGDRPEAFFDIVSDFLDRGMSFLFAQQETLINP